MFEEEDCCNCFRGIVVIGVGVLFFCADCESPVTTTSFNSFTDSSKTKSFVVVTDKSTDSTIILYPM